MQKLQSPPGVVAHTLCRQRQANHYGYEVNLVYGMSSRTPEQLGIHREILSEKLTSQKEKRKRGMLTTCIHK